MKSKNMRVAMLLVPNIVCVAPTDCQAGELLCSIQHEQNKLPHVTANQVMQNVFKNYNNLNIEVKNTLNTIWNNDAGNLLLRKTSQCHKG